MKTLDLFYQNYCPYGEMAEKAIGELTKENEAYSAVTIRRINENAERALADSMDYWYVPTIYCEGEKLYEASPRHSYNTIKENVRKALDHALE